MKAIKNLRDQAVSVIGSFSLPRLPVLGRTVDLPVYVIHNSNEIEDYFFIFDFEQFVEASQQGSFVRPRLKVWAGRSDFNRRKFAREFRLSFSREFEAARRALVANNKQGGGWFGWLGSGISIPGEFGLPLFVAQVVLLVGASAGKLVWKQLMPSNWFSSKSDEHKLEDSIEQTKIKVDDALQHLDIVLHMDLYRHAYRDGPAGRMTGVDYDAWPLPAYVQEHLATGVSGSWW